MVQFQIKVLLPPYLYGHYQLGKRQLYVSVPMMAASLAQANSALNAKNVTSTYHLDYHLT
jgi:hypothetical protein